MDHKSILTEEERRVLLNKSKTLKPGEAIEGVLRTSISTDSSLPYKEQIDFIENNIIVFPGTELSGDNIRGRVNVEVFKSHQIMTGKKKPFSLKRGLEALRRNIEAKITDMTLSMYGFVYNFDNQGRAYFQNIDGDIFYVNKDCTGCITADKEYYYELVPTETSFKLRLCPDADTTYFEYFYRTSMDYEEARRQSELEDADPFKIIDLDAYRNSKEEGPRR